MKKTVTLAAAVLGTLPVLAGGPADIPCIDFSGQGVPVKRLNGMCNTIPMMYNLFPARTNLMTQQIRALRFGDVAAFQQQGAEPFDGGQRRPQVVRNCPQQIGPHALRFVLTPERLLILDLRCQCARDQGDRNDDNG